MKICFISHSIAGDTNANLADLRRIIYEINSQRDDVVPLCGYYADVVSMNDGDPLQRLRGIRNNAAILKSGMVKEMWLTGRVISDGMREEINIAYMKGIPVVDYINKL